MRVSIPEVLIDIDPLKRRMLRFVLTFDQEVVLDLDVDHERETKRHKFRPVRYWSRRSHIGFGVRLENQREVPREAIEQALSFVRSKIVYRG